MDSNNLWAKCEVRESARAFPTLIVMRQPPVIACQGGKFFIHIKSAKPDKHLQLVNDPRNIGNRKMLLYKIILVINKVLS